MDGSLIKQAADALSIQGVFLRGSALRVADELGPQPGAAELALTPQYRAGATGQINMLTAKLEEPTVAVPRIVVFFFEAGIRLVDSDALSDDDSSAEVSDDAVRLEITATFAAHYLLRDGVDHDKVMPALEEFATCNVGYHVWPYWRELVQSTCARIGIPPVPVPMYRVPDTDVVEEDDKE